MDDSLMFSQRLSSSIERVARKTKANPPASPILSLKFVRQVCGPCGLTDHGATEGSWHKCDGEFRFLARNTIGLREKREFVVFSFR